jgi:hypothetical protein
MVLNETFTVSKGLGMGVMLAIADAGIKTSARTQNS